MRLLVVCLATSGDEDPEPIQALLNQYAERERLIATVETRYVEVPNELLDPPPGEA